MNFREKFNNIFRFYIAIPDIIGIALVVGVFWQPLTNFFSSLLSRTLPHWLGEITMHILAELIALVIVGFGWFFLLHSRKLHAMAGSFTAIDTTNGKNEDWGVVTLTHELFDTTFSGPRMRIRICKDNIEIQGDAIVVGERYLVGAYLETSQPIRRRYGAFLLAMSGNADVYEGDFLYLDPNTAQPTKGTVRWTRK